MTNYDFPNQPGPPSLLHMYTYVLPLMALSPFSQVRSPLVPTNCKASQSALSHPCNHLIHYRRSMLHIGRAGQLVVVFLPAHPSPLSFATKKVRTHHRAPKPSDSAPGINSPRRVGCQAAATPAGPVTTAARKEKFRRENGDQNE